MAVLDRIQTFPIQMAGPGVDKSLPPYLIPQNTFSDVLNARFYNGLLQKVYGWQKFSSVALSGTPMLIDQFFLSSGADYLILITTTKMYKWNTATLVFDDITGTAFTGTASDLFQADTGFDLFVCVNDKDTVKKWDGAAGTYLALGGMTDVEFLDGTGTIAVTTASFIRFFKNFFVIGNVTENGTRKPSRLRWSRLGLAENWKNDGSGNGQAGAVDIGSVDWILTAEILGDTFVVYKERSIWAMNYVGLPLIFDFREKVSGIGPVGPRAVGNLGDDHLIVAQDDIYFFNGESIESVGGPIRQFFFRTVAPTTIDRTTVFIIEEFNEAMISFISTANTDGQFDMALVYNYLERTWSIRDLKANCFGYYRRTDDLAWEDDMDSSWAKPLFPGSWDDRVFLDVAPINIFAALDGYVYQFQNYSKAGVAAVNLSATTKMYDLGDPTAYKRVQRIQLLVKQQSSNTIMIELGTSENIDDTVNWGEVFTIALDSTANPFVDVDVTGRFFSVRITQTGDAQETNLAGVILHFLMKGRK